MPNLSGNLQLLERKKKILEELLINLQREEELLSYRDADNAVKLENKNQVLLEALKELDMELGTKENQVIPSAQEILVSAEIFEILDKARICQNKVQSLLEFECKESKKEYWETSIKRRLKTHLSQSTGFSWTKNYC